MAQLIENRSGWQNLIANFFEVFLLPDSPCDGRRVTGPSTFLRALSLRSLRLCGESGLVQPFVDAAWATCYSESPTTVASSNPCPYQPPARTLKPTEEYAWPPQ
jgi:hypothetical protein